MRYLFVGGSNGLIEGGFGQILCRTVPGDWINQSLGSSSSARGLDWLYANPDTVQRADRIVFEYTLNDLIFEGANTLDAAGHSLCLQALVSKPALARRLVFVLLCGRGQLARVTAGQSFVIDTYRRLAASAKIPLIDLTTELRQQVTLRGADAVFKDNDHFSEAVVPLLVRTTAHTLAALPPPSTDDTVVPSEPVGWRVARVHPLDAPQRSSVGALDFRNSLVDLRLAVLSTGGSITLQSPGGLLLGWYERCGRDAGLLQLTSPRRTLVKTARHRFPNAKPFVAFRHLSSPLPTTAGEILVLRAIDRLASAPSAQLDHTLAEVVNGVGGEVALGEMVYLQPPETFASIFPPLPMQKIPSTLRSLHDSPGEVRPSSVAGRYLRAPKPAFGRLAEGGLRLASRYKRSAIGQPLVSVITVCLNTAATIERTIQSVLAQTYGNLEYVVVDGCSNDGTIDILRRHEHELDYFVSEPDGGLYAAMNKGIALASGDFILILNADDWYDDDAVSSLVDVQTAAGVDFVSARARNVDADGLVAGDIRSMPWDASIRLRMPLRHETMLIPRALYNAAGDYDESYRIIADFKFTLRLHERGCTHVEIPRSLMSFSTTGVSSTALTKLTAERARLMREQFAELDDTDIALLATHGSLTPNNVMELARRYSNEQRLLETLAAFVRYQQSVGARRWAGFDANLVLMPAAAPVAAPRPPCTMRIATMCSMDHGGAGTGTQRRVEALRRQGIDAHIHALLVKSPHDYVHRVVPSLPGVDTSQQDEVWQQVRLRAIRPVRQVPGYRASELFSLPESVVGTSTLARISDEVDIVHLHWVVGMIDHENAGPVLADKPLVWTLADMNAFTGGCHYSEGCEGYKRECHKCPLLGGMSDLAHQVWKRKKAFYAQLQNLQIVCPSRWIYDRVRASSLLGDRVVHHIPNAFPVDRFELTHKIVARLRLGLPLDRKLILFGADSLGNKRKGGDHLKAALGRLKTLRRQQDVSVVLFGSSTTELPVPSYPLGYISDDRQLALAYSAADVFVSPSDEDSGPMTVGESLLCGTPVVAFKVGIALEMIRHHHNGALATRGSVEELALGLRWALEADEKTALRRSLDCRIGARAFHDPAVAAQRHHAVYVRALNSG